MMAQKQLFLIDGISFHVDVTKLTRKFSVLDTEKSGRTLDGQMYREPIGTFYNYTMTIRGRSDDPAAMDALWELISQPTTCHVCVFPYGQNTLTQKMYVTGGEQSLVLFQPNANHWGEITLNFIAMGPKVTP